MTGCQYHKCIECGFMETCDIFLKYLNVRKDKDYFSDALDEEVGVKLDMMVKLDKAEKIIKDFMRISAASVEEFEPEFTALIKEAEDFINK